MKNRFKFPEQDFCINCGDVPEVRQALKDAGFKWYGGQELTDRLLGRKFLHIYEDKSVTYSSTPIPHALSLKDLLVPVLSYEEIFIKFLKKHRAYTAYISVYTEEWNPPDHTKLAEAVDRCGFVWGEEKDKLSFGRWFNISNEWRALCKHFGISNVIIGKSFMKLKKVETNE